MGSWQEPENHGTAQRAAGHRGVGSLGASLSSVSTQRLRDLATDQAVQARQLGALVEGLSTLAEAWEHAGAGAERVDAAALRLQSFHTGIERCLVQIVRVLNGGTPEGADWHRRLLERLSIATDNRPALLSSRSAGQQGELLRFRQLVRHLYAYDLDSVWFQLGWRPLRSPSPGTAPGTPL